MCHSSEGFTVYMFVYTMKTAHEQEGHGPFSQHYPQRGV